MCQRRERRGNLNYLFFSIEMPTCDKKGTAPKDILEKCLMSCLYGRTGVKYYKKCHKDSFPSVPKCEECKQGLDISNHSDSCKYSYDYDQVR